MRKHITYIIVPSLKINSKSISVSSFVNKNLAERERERDRLLSRSKLVPLRTRTSSFPHLRVTAIWPLL